METPSAPSAKTSNHAGLLLVGLVTSVVMLLVVWPAADISLGGDQYVHLARSFARGSLDVDAMSPMYRDYVEWEGHKYLPFGPLPAVLLVPFVWLLNAGVPLVFFGYALTAVNVVLFYRVLARAGVTGERRWWIVLLYFGGTMYLSVALVGISTFFAHIVVTTFLLAAVLEMSGRQRLLVVGLCIGLAASARMTAAFSLPFFLWMARDPAPSGVARPVAVKWLLIAAGLLAPLLLLAGYNYARFGDPAETGFALALLYDPALERARAAGLFSLAHVPKNLFMMLVEGPRPVGGEGAAVLAFPYIEPSPWGMGLFFTTPALIYAMRAPLNDRLVQACWLAIVATLVPLLTYYGIGFVQFGYRYALDFMPFLLLLVARGFPSALTRTARGLISASVAINIWGAVTLAIRL